MIRTAHTAPPHALDAVPRSPAIDSAPPVSPNMARAPEIKQIHQNFLETLLFKGISSPLALVLVVVQSRFLHASGRGSFVLVVLSVTILTRLLGQLGYAVTSRMRQQGVEVKTLVQAALAVGFVLGGLGMAAIVAWGSVTGGIGTKVAAIAAAALVPNIVWQLICGVLLGLNRVRLWNVIQTMPPIFTLVGMLIFVVGLHDGLTGAILAWTLAHVLTALVALVASRDVWRPMPLREWVDLFDLPLARLALAMGAVQVVNLISYRIEMIVLQRSHGVASVGVYSIAVQTAEMLWLIGGSLTTAMTGPCLNDEEEQASTLVTRASAKTLAYSAIVAVGVGAFVPYLIGPLLGHAFSGAGDPLRLLLPGIVVYSPVTILVVYLSVRHAKPKLSLAVSIAGMIVTLIAALLLIPSHGASGAALASTLGYAAGAGLAWVFFTRLSRTARAASAPVTEAARASARAGP